MELLDSKNIYDAKQFAHTFVHPALTYERKFGSKNEHMTLWDLDDA